MANRTAYQDWIENEVFGHNTHKMQRLQDDPVWPLIAHIKAQADLAPMRRVELALRIIEEACVATDQLVLYTSGRLDQVQVYVTQNPDHDYLHTTPAGYGLLCLNLYQTLGYEAGYLLGNVLSAKLVQETRSENVVLIADPQDQTSSLWTLEAHCAQYNSGIERFQLCNGVLQQWHEDMGALKPYAHPHLLEWQRLLEDYLNCECAETLENLQVHPLAQKYRLGDTPLKPDEMNRVRNICLDMMLELWPCYCQQNEREAPLPGGLSASL